MKDIRHIAFIMDGNGRWAQARGLARSDGHKQGVLALEKIIKACNNMGIEVVSFYAFSTENWKRSVKEKNTLFDMVKRFADDELSKYANENMRTNFMGDISKLPKKVQLSLNKVIESTANNTGMIINIGLNYGARAEIINAVNRLLSDNIRKINEKDFVKYLYTCDLPDPDIVVRTSGEMRLSNFMLYQSAYSELIFMDEMWPDFDEKSLENVISIYRGRTRKFGSIKE